MNRGIDAFGEVRDKVTGSSKSHLFQALFDESSSMRHLNAMVVDTIHVPKSALAACSDIEALSLQLFQVCRVPTVILTRRRSPVAFAHAV